MELTYIKAINSALMEEMRRDENVFVMGEDVGELGGAFKATEGLLEAFGEERVIDTPISEALIVGAGIGAAVLGMRPVLEMQFADFISCAFDQIVNMAATTRYRHGGQVQCPLVVRAPSGAGIHGALFHSQNPEAWFTRVPGLKVVAPATVYDAKGLLKAAIRDNNPVIYFEHKRLYRSIKEDLPDADFTVPLGVAEVRKPGGDLSLITYGGTLGQSLDAAKIVEKEDGLAVEVLDLRTLLPLDREAILATARKTGKVLIVHEDRLTGGIGGEVAALISEHAFESLDGPVRRLGAMDTHVAFSPPLEEAILPNTNKIVDAIRSLAAY
ncbi:MAG TPA: alpha-ketoacid dehydrogenase subunit beta [Candidatus Binataceae bacterium]|nr:alpha-ketoacid dehydrogenase subunit beta [Candidatus Binataceae bacterium]